MPGAAPQRRSPSSTSAATAHQFHRRHRLAQARTYERQHQLPGRPDPPLGTGRIRSRLDNIRFDVRPVSSAAPELGVWAMMILGTGCAGAALRRRRALARLRRRFHGSFTPNGTPAGTAMTETGRRRAAWGAAAGASTCTARIPPTGRSSPSQAASSRSSARPWTPSASPWSSPTVRPGSEP